MENSLTDLSLLNSSTNYPLYSRTLYREYNEAGGDAGAGSDGGSDDGGDDDGSPPPKGDTSSDSGGKVPYERLKEKSDALKAANARIAEFEAKEADRKQKELAEKGNYEEALKELQPKAERAGKLEETIVKLVERELENIPEELRSLVPASLSPEDKLQYIADNRDILFGNEEKKTVNASTNPGGGEGDTGDKPTYTVAQISDPAFYQKNREDILLAQKEGRIKG